MVKSRKEVDVKDCWNVEALYPSLSAWRADFNTLVGNSSPRFPALQNEQGTLNQGPQQIKKVLEFFFNLDRKLSKLYTYAHLKHDEDIADNEAKVAYVECLSAYNDFAQEVSWFEPELLSLPQEKLETWLKDPVLKEYQFHLEKIIRMKPYTLSADKERLLAMSGKALAASHKAFSAITDADFQFGSVEDSQGNSHEITHAKYGLILRSPDRILRENAFKQYFGQYKKYENTLCELLNGQVEAHVFNAKARGFPSALDAALYPKNIPTKVYHSLIEAVHEEIDALHDYMKLRSKVLQLKPLHFYDLQVPLVADFDVKISYEEAENLVIDSVAPLGAEYQNILKKGFKTDRWVDRYENKNKRSGAYSSGCFDSMPYILMNYKDIVRDLFTLAHEAGHSMHSFLSRQNQLYPYSGYSIFVAEVASTFNEELLMQTVLKNASSIEAKIFYLTQKIEDIRATLFRQTQFAEFEWLIHSYAEKNTALTPQLLNEEYLKLNHFYYGMNEDKEMESEWSRIPHFYYNFYVYQYATGISAALALADRVLEGGQKEREDYLNFLKAGESVYPIDALKIAGIDMTSTEPVKRAISRFKKLLKELENLVSQNLALK